MKRTIILLYLILFICICNITFSGFTTLPNNPKVISDSVLWAPYHPMAVSSTSYGSNGKTTLVVWAENCDYYGDHISVKCYYVEGGESANNPVEICRKSFPIQYNPEKWSKDDCSPADGHEGLSCMVNDIEIISKPIINGLAVEFWVAILYECQSLDWDGQVHFATWRFIEAYQVIVYLGEIIVNQWEHQGKKFIDESLYLEAPGYDCPNPPITASLLDVAIERFQADGSDEIFVFWPRVEVEENLDSTTLIHFKEIKNNTKEGILTTYLGSTIEVENDFAWPTGNVTIDSSASSDGRIWLVWGNDYDNNHNYIPTISVGKFFQVINNQGRMNCLYEHIVSLAQRPRISADLNRTSQPYYIYFTYGKENTHIYARRIVEGDGLVIEDEKQISNIHGGNFSDITYIQSNKAIVSYESWGLIYITKWDPTSDANTEKEIKVADSYIYSVNPTSNNQRARIATMVKTGPTYIDNFSLVWGGTNSLSECKVVVRKSNDIPFKTALYLGKGFKVNTNNNGQTFYLTRVYYFIRAEEDGPWVLGSEMEFNTSAFQDGDQVYKANLSIYIDALDICSLPGMLLLYDPFKPRDLNCGESLGSIPADATPGWREYDISEQYNYFKRRPGGWDYIYLVIDTMLNPHPGSFVQIAVYPSSNSPKLFIKYIDWANN